MLSKCANPGCSAAFLYLSRGKLFRWEPNAAKGNKPASAAAQSVNTNRRVEFFWLCEECSAAMTLVFDKGAVAARPLLLVKAAAAAASTSGRLARVAE